MAENSPRKNTNAAMVDPYALSSEEDHTGGQGSDEEPATASNQQAESESEVSSRGWSDADDTSEDCDIPTQPRRSHRRKPQKIHKCPDSDDESDDSDAEETTGRQRACGMTDSSSGHLVHETCTQKPSPPASPASKHQVILFSPQARAKLPLSPPHSPFRTPVDIDAHHEEEEGEDAYETENAPLAEPSMREDDSPLVDETVDSSHDIESPPPERAPTQENDEKSNGDDRDEHTEVDEKRERLVLCWLLVCLGCGLMSLATLVGGVIGVAFLGDDDDESSGVEPAVLSLVTNTPSVLPTRSPVSPPSPEPTFSPTASPTDQPSVAFSETPSQIPSSTVFPKDQELWNLLTMYLVDGGNSIMTELDSPQRRAYEWLENDTFQAPDDSRKLQRFALATFYYSAGGENWVTRAGWLKPIDECLWHTDSLVAFSCSNGVFSTLEMNENNVGGTLPTELALLTGLTRVVIKSNPVGAVLTGGIPSYYGRLSNLVDFELSGNRFTEPLPPELFPGWGSLDRLILPRNTLPGSIPNTLGDLTNVTRFDVGENLLTGPIPISVGDMNQLRTFLVNNNTLEGSFPAELGTLTTIKGGIDVSHNGLTGNIPLSVEALKEMKVFSVTDNQLTGPVPDFSALTSLRTFRIDNTGLSGEVPAGTCAAIRLSSAEAYADCPTEVTCTCCTHCCTDGGSCNINLSAV